MLEGFRSRCTTRLPVRGLDRVAAVDHQAQALLDGRVAARGSTPVTGSPSTSSRTKYGRPSAVAAVEQARDVRVLEAGEDLPLAQEAPPDRLGVHAAA